MTAIRVSGVVHVYPTGVRALDGIDLAVARGECVALVGQNGSGKSTLVRHLNGLLRPTSGAVALDDMDISRERVSRLARRVGLAFQHPDEQIFSGSVRAEVAFGARNVGLRGGPLDDAVDAALRAVGLEGQGEVNPYDLGFARRKLLTIASVLAMRTPVVVLDEPTTGQDANGVRRVEEVVGAVAAEGRTVLTISHDMRFVAGSFGRVVVLRQGRVVLDGAPEDVFSPSNRPLLRSTSLQPPLAADVGERLGLGRTPTDASLVAALRERDGRERDGR